MDNLQTVLPCLTWIDKTNRTLQLAATGLFPRAVAFFFTDVLPGSRFRSKTAHDMSGLSGFLARFERFERFERFGRFVFL